MTSDGTAGPRSLLALVMARTPDLTPKMSLAPCGDTDVRTAGVRWPILSRVQVRPAARLCSSWVPGGRPPARSARARSPFRERWTRTATHDVPSSDPSLETILIGMVGSRSWSPSRHSLHERRGGGPPGGLPARTRVVAARIHRAPMGNSTLQTQPSSTARSRHPHGSTSSTSFSTAHLTSWTRRLTADRTACASARISGSRSAGRPARCVDEVIDHLPSHTRGSPGERRTS